MDLIIRYIKYILINRGGISLKKKSDLKTIVANLSKVGVNVSVTKSRVELLKVLTPPTRAPHPQN
jgi:hypothetical protein